jgi:hypothetical protein
MHERTLLVPPARFSASGCVHRMTAHEPAARVHTHDAAARMRDGGHRQRPCHGLTCMLSFVAAPAKRNLLPTNTCTKR